MRIFVTGASGFIGSAVTTELLQNGHQVVGLARSDASAAALETLGAEVRRGELADVDGLRSAAADSDGVIHLGFIHDFSDFAASVETDRQAIRALGAGLEGSDRPLVAAAGILFVAPGEVVTERHPIPADFPRASEHEALSLADRGVRAAAVRLSPSVHGEGDGAFVATLAAIAREHGVSAYVDAGESRWPAVHRFDAARLFRLAVESAPAGSVLHGTAEEGIPTRDIAAALGRRLDLPVASRPAEHFGWLGPFFGSDAPASSAITRDLLGWEPTGPGLIEDIDAGVYGGVGATSRG